MVYRLNADDVVVTYRKGLLRSVQSLPIKVFRDQHSRWEMTNNTWIALALVSVVAIAFGVWGFIDPKSTGMYMAIAVSLVVLGFLMPYLFWNHRRLTGVTFSGDPNHSLAVIAHAVPTQQFDDFVNAMQQRIQSGSDAIDFKAC